MESKPNKSPEGQPVEGRRNFLKNLGGLGVAAGLTALGVSGTAEAKANTKGSTLESGVLVYFLFGGFDKTSDEKKRTEIVNEIKTQNTTAELEKKLINDLSDNDIAGINSNPDHAAKIVHDTRINRWKKKGEIAATILTTGIGIGAAAGHKLGAYGSEKEGVIEGTVFGAIVGTMAAAAILGSEPTPKNGKAAEESLLKWIEDEIRLVGSVSREAIRERIEDLTKLQKANSAQIATL